MTSSLDSVNMAGDDGKTPPEGDTAGSDRVEATADDLEDPHFRLLYALSRYATAAVEETDDEGWIREVPLNVMIFEGVRAGALDFDYAPCSQLVSYEGVSRRLWINVSQEGRSAMNDLRESGMLNGLKLSTEDFQPVTAYQVSHKGMEVVAGLSQELKDEVDASGFIFPPGTPKEDWDDDHLLRCTYDGDEFYLINDAGYKRDSDVNDAEDVSYVSSPWLPQCVRQVAEKHAGVGGPPPFTDNAYRAHEAAVGETGIEDELDEAIALAHPRTLVGEWIPFGANQIVALNERLGALDRCQGGFFTAIVDTDPTASELSTPPGTTDVKILDFDFVKFINFEAEVNFPEEGGVIQVETFGMHLNVDGTIIYGMTIEAIMERTAESINVDNLSRLLVDVHQDSSEIMNDLLTDFQRSLLDMLFVGDMVNRGKYNMIVADAIQPKLPAASYMDRSAREDELKQVLGDIMHAYDLGPDDVLILGRDGMLLAGPNATGNDVLLVAYCKLLVKELFIRNYFVRTFILDAVLEKNAKLIMEWRQDPFHIGRIRANCSKCAQDMIKMEELLGYLRDSLAAFKIPPLDPEETNQSRKELYKRLDLEQMRHNINLRATDLVKLVDGIHQKLNIQQKQSTGINTQTLESTVLNIDANYRILVDASAADERASQSAEIMNIVLAGSFAFHIIDRLDGDDMLGYNGVGGADYACKWIDDYTRDTLMVYFPLWLLSNFLWLLAISVGLLKYMRYLGALGLEAYSIRCVVNKKIHPDVLRKFVEGAGCLTVDIVRDEVTDSTTLKASFLDVDGAASKKELKERAKKKAAKAKKRAARIAAGYDEEELALAEKAEAEDGGGKGGEGEGDGDGDGDGSDDEGGSWEEEDPYDFGTHVNQSGLTRWQGVPANISISCDMVQGFLMHAVVQWNMRETPMTSLEIQDVFHHRMSELGIFVEEEKEQVEKLT